jgi:hypothetical protein
VEAAVVITASGMSVVTIPAVFVVAVAVTRGGMRARRV